MTSARGFTVAELLVALALSMVVLGGAMGVLVFTSQSARMQGERFDNRVELRVTQLTVRRAMGMMVAGIPAQPEEGEPSDDEEDQGADEPLDSLQEEPGEAAGETSDEPAQENTFQELGSGFDPYLEPDYFELYFEQEPVGSTDIVYLPRMVLMLRESPVGTVGGDAGEDQEPIAAGRMWRGGWLGERPTDVVRGAFEVRFNQVHGWTLFWQPIEPEGEATRLLTKLRMIRWTVLPRDLESSEWPEVWAAYLSADFPVVVRLMLETEQGLTADWAFEVNVITRGEGS